MRLVLFFAVILFSFISQSGADDVLCREYTFGCFNSTEDLQAGVDEYLDVVLGMDDDSFMSTIVDCLGDISEWCVSDVKSFESVFDASRNPLIADVFNGDLSAWDVSKATDMTHMFRGASAFNADISGWDTAQVKSLEGTFTDAASFNIAITDWDTSKVINMRETFMGAISFDQSLRRWDTSKVYFMNSMFFEASAFRGTGIFKWDVARVRKMNRMFFKAKKMRADLSGWDTASVTTMDGMFGKAKKFNADLSGWNVESVTNMKKMFFKAKKFSQDLCSWGDSLVANSVNVAAMFDGSGCEEESDPDLSSSNVVVGPVCHVCLDSPTGSPVTTPSVAPTMSPTISPTISPTMSPTMSSTISPTMSSTISPTISPTMAPSMSPTMSPTLSPTISPTMSPTLSPTISPTQSPTLSPTMSPTMSPSMSPTMAPSISLTCNEESTFDMVSVLEYNLIPSNVLGFINASYSNRDPTEQEVSLMTTALYQYSEALLEESSQVALVSVSSTANSSNFVNTGPFGSFSLSIETGITACEPITAQVLQNVYDTSSNFTAFLIDHAFPLGQLVDPQSVLLFVDGNATFEFSILI